MIISNTIGIFTAAMIADDTVLMIGLHGIGKTEVVKAWAKANDVHLEVLYLSTQEVGDLIGIPTTTTLENGTVITVWTVPSWLNNLNEASARGQKTCVFLDELSRAPLDVRQASLQLVLDREIHQHQLPIHEDGTRTLIIAADNPDNGMYAVEAMDPALLDRFLTIQVEVDVKSWLDWGRDNKVNEVVRSFIADNPSKIHYTPDQGSENSDGTPDTIGATPRSWTKLGKFIDNLDNIPRELHYDIIKGKIGTALALQFQSHLKNFENLVSVDDIVTLVRHIEPKTNKIEKIGEAVAELLGKSEAMQITELVQGVVTQHRDDENVLLGMLYSLPLELLAGFLKDTRKEDKDLYSHLRDTDDARNNKKLFLKIVDYI